MSVTIIEELLCGAAGGMLGTACSHPLDTLKTRMQAGIRFDVPQPMGRVCGRKPFWLPRLHARLAPVASNAFRGPLSAAPPSGIPLERAQRQPLVRSRFVSGSCPGARVSPSVPNQA